jgi:hypothetical protein
MPLVNGHEAGVQGVNTLSVNVGADYVMASFSQARGSNQADIPAANDGKIQGEAPPGDYGARTGAQSMIYIIADAQPESS